MNKKIFIGVFVFVICLAGEWVRTEIGNLKFEVSRLKQDSDYFNARHYETRSFLSKEVRDVRRELEEIRNHKKEEVTAIQKQMWLVDFVMAAIQQIDAR